MHHEPSPTTQPDGRRRRTGGGALYLTDAEISARWGLSPATIWRMRRRGLLPRAERISPGRVATPLAVIEEIERQRAEDAAR